MKFSDIIRTLKETVPIQFSSILENQDILDVAFLEGSEAFFLEHTLYFGYYEQLHEAVSFPAQCILGSDEDILPILENTDVVFVTKEQLFTAFNQIKKLLDKTVRMNLSTLLIHSAAAEKSIDIFMNTAATQLGNSLILLDIDFNILSYSTVFPINDFIWAENIKQGYCSYEFVTAVKQLETVKNSPNTSVPIEVNCPESKFRKLSSKILHNGVKVGILVMLEKETPISPIMIEQLEIISIAASIVLVRYVPYLLTDKNQYEHLLYNLLIGTPPKALTSQIQGLSFPSQMNAITLHETRYLGQKHLKEQILSKLKMILTGAYIIPHGSSIAGIIPHTLLSDLKEIQLKNLQQFCKREFIQIGISNIFFDIESFVPCYNQACRALYLNETLHSENPIVQYEEYQFFDLLEHFSRKDKLGTFCHPALGILNRYDQMNGTDLYHTLKAYLFCNCSIKKTAEILFIHRNSLSYRLERICELTQINLSDSNIQFLLTMSYKIDEFIGKG